MDKKRILVIDDETELVKAIQIRLDQAGYEVLFAYDGKEGLEKARKEKPDLIILDLMLPRLPGTEVCKEIKKDEKIGKIPIIMLTAKDSDVDKVIGKVIGANYYMIKPFDAEGLLDLIKKYI